MVVSTLAKATGHQIKGWRALTETVETPHRLKELGFTYILWCADDQPFALKVPGVGSVFHRCQRHRCLGLLGATTCALPMQAQL